ncbi:MAG TPA: hypothetical protein VK326_01605 [Solirubrobacterales bacterium]|nr:hypothetical protein [Solirubrobacterales bacterium]
MATVSKGPRTEASECRRCRTFCDKLIEPRGCIEIGCRFLYSYEDQLTGGRYMGCMRKVFSAEIDIDMFELAEASGGFGGLKMTGDSLPQCQFRVEPSYEGDGPAYSCVNRAFFDCTDSAPEGIRAFDLRNALGSARRRGASF